MSKKDIQKNFKLSAKFNDYAVKHPEVLKDISSSVCIVMGSEKDLKLTRKNKELAKKIIKKERKKCYQAMRIKGGWKIAPVGA